MHALKRQCHADVSLSPCCMQEPCTQRCCKSAGRTAISAVKDDEHCVHSHGSVYHVTAMCQSCHTNRSLLAV